MTMGELRSKTVGLLGKAVEKVLADEKRAAKVAQAVGAVQKGKQQLDRAQENLLKGLGVATRGDYKDVGKRLSALKRRVRHLADRLEAGARGP
jgi:polyhydroxyalkanoate synthesis regulator phasin